VGGDSDNKKLFYFSIKQFFFAIFGVEMILDKLRVSKSTKFTTHKIEKKQILKNKNKKIKNKKYIYIEHCYRGIYVCTLNKVCKNMLSN